MHNESVWQRNVPGIFEISILRIIVLRVFYFDHDVRVR